MKYNKALLISALFPFAFWLPFSQLPDTTYKLTVNHHNSEPTIVVAEKDDLALFWFVILLAINPFPWLMWACVLRDLKLANKQLQARHQAPESQFLSKLREAKLSNYLSNK
jgi:hypothetical protein